MNKLKSLLVGVVVIMGLSLPQLSRAASLTLETAGQTNGLVVFNWTNTAGQTYLLQYKTNLTQGNWEILTGAIITTNARVPASDLIASLGAGRFYRVWILTTNVSDTTKPTLVISTPTSGQSVSNATFLIQGTAADNKLVAAVAYQINSNNWAGAFTANKWTNWTATAGLIPGTNILKAYAVDTNANISTTNSVSFVYVLSALLAVNTNGFGSVNPNYNGALLQLGRGYSMTATAGTGCLFTNWTGSLTTNSATLQFVMASNLMFTANFIDTNKPGATISTPTNNQRWSNVVFTVAGTASDNVRVANVSYQLNGNGWNPAVTANAWSNWTAGVTLIPGTNTVQACSADTTGNKSATNSMTFVYVLSDTLRVQAVGRGVLSPNYSNAVLEIGKSYSLTATPTNGHKFARWETSTNWVSPVVTTNATLAFQMQSNLTLQVTFVDTNRPVVAITSPTNNQRWSNAVFTVTGTANDNVRVTNAWYQLNGAGWSPVTTGNNWSNWTAGINLTPGTNVVQAYSVDTTGNKSATNTVNFVYVVSDTLRVQAVGRGVLSPNYSNAVLEIGKSYSLTATATNGHKFAWWETSTNWVSPVVTTNATLAFQMQSNLTLQVTFVDTNRPVVAITSPTNNQRWSNAVFTVTGTASDNVRVTNVWYQLNGAGWSPVTTGNNWSNWTAGITLTPGTNVVRAYSVDATGNSSTTNSVSFVYVLSDTLRVQAVGRGVLSPNYSNAVLEIGKSYSLTATATNGHKFARWETSTNWVSPVVTTNATLAFQMQSNLTLQVTFVDTNRPVVAITSPTNNQRWSNAVFTVTGTASDNVRVTNVWYQLNGAGWSPVTTGNNWSNWTAGITLTPGTNVVQAYSADAAGNISITSTQSMQYVLTALATVQTNGRGTISPNYNGQLLEIGKGYSMTATPSAGFGFVSWTGTVTTNGSTVNFVMQSNLVLTASFADTNKPTVTITFPTLGQATTNAIIMVGGTANDNVQVIGVFCQLNGGSWTNAATTNNWTNWTATLPAMAGTNAVKAYAVDAAGNHSTTNTSTFNHTPPTLVLILPLPKAHVSQLYNQLVGQASNGAPPYKYTVQPASGALPAGMTLDLNGNLSGTPTAAGTFTFGVCVTDQAGAQDCKTSTLVVGPQVFTLTVVKVGSGSGTVTSIAGINCGAVCTVNLDSNTIVTLTAVPSAGSTFTGWGGAASGTGSGIVTMISNETVTAAFSTSPTLSLWQLPNAQVDQYYSQQVVRATTGGVPPYAYQLDTAGGFPPIGIHLDGSGTLTGTPSIAGTYTFAVCAVDQVGAQMCSNATLTVNPVVLSISDVSATEGNSGTKDFVFNVTLSAPRTTNTVKVNYSTTNYSTITNTATAGSDYVAIPPGTNSLLTFNPGETNKMIIVKVNGDTTVEADETFFVNLSFPVNAVIGDSSGIGTIVDDDTPVALTVTRAGTGSGTVSSAPAGINCGATCAANFSKGTTVTLTAFPGSGSTFVGWSGDASGTGDAVVTMNTGKLVTATFNTNPPTPPTITITSVAKTVTGHTSLWTDYSVTVSGTTTGTPYDYSYQAGYGVFGLVNNTLTSTPENWSFTFTYTQFGTGTSSTYQIWAEEYDGVGNLVASKYQYVTFVGL